MASDSQRPFRLGSWLVEPDLNRLSQDEVVVHLEPKTMEVLLYLCQRPGEVFSADQIIAEVWDNRPMGDNPVYKAIAKLRKALGDDSGHTTYIQTVSKKGYRLIADIDKSPLQTPDSTSSRTENNTSNSLDPTSGSGARRFALPVTFGIVVGIALAAAIFWRPATSPLTLTGMSTFSGSHRQPTFAPDGKGFAFVSSGSGSAQIWILNPEQAQPQQLTFGERNTGRPRWSLDGETILFGRQGSLWSVAASGGEPVEIIRDAYNANWSRDSEKIVFERRYEIWVADAGGARQERVAGVPKRELPLSPRWPAFSPDGTEIVFFNPETTPLGNLWSVRLDGSGLRQLTFFTSFGSAPVWSPDGRSIIYSSERNGNRNLWKVDVDNLTEEVLLTSSGDDDFPDLSADGSRLIYSNQRERFTLLSSNPRDGRETVLHESRLLLVGPELSVDGETLVFFGGSRSGGFQISTIPTVGGEPTEITSNADALHALPHWAFDKQSIYFFFTGDSDYFANVPAQGGAPTIVADGWTWDIANGAKIDPTGSRIIYSRLTGQTPVQTLIRDIESGEDTAFYATLEYPRWSADGLRVTGALHVDQRFPGDVAVCPVAGPECLIVAEDGRVPVWSLDNELIYFVRGFGRSQQLFVVPADGSAAERPVMKMAPLHPLSNFYQVTTDHEIVWVRQSNQQAEIWIADL